jgi:hypothetical protein
MELQVSFGSLHSKISSSSLAQLSENSLITANKFPVLCLGNSHEETAISGFLAAKTRSRGVFLKNSLQIPGYQGI